MNLQIAGSEDMIFEGNVYGFSASAIDGKITFLNNHVNYLTEIKKGEIVLIDEANKTTKRKVTLKSDSLLLIENNRAIIFC